jgi:hypothetical protein
MNGTEKEALGDVCRAWDAKGDKWHCEPIHAALHVRVTRCLSWLQHIEESESQGTGGSDARLVFGWIALNALYGCWDYVLQRGKDNDTAMGELVDRVCRADRDGALDNALNGLRRQIHTIGRDEGLSRSWWRTETPEVPPGHDREASRMLDALGEGRVAEALRRLLLRIYVARCQLVHGGATCGSALNRDAVDACAHALVPLVLAIVGVIIGRCSELERPTPCYPPPRSRLPDRGRVD